jgi:DNA polymerase elongation subunit (family B)
MKNTKQDNSKTSCLDKLVYLDVECYPNYFLIYFYCDGKSQYFEIRDDEHFTNTQMQDIKNILCRYTTVGFNSNNYDIPMISFALTGCNTANLKEGSDSLINKPKNVLTWKIMRHVGVRRCDTKQHIDIKDVIAGSTSLKSYAARIGFKKLQDLPYDPAEPLTKEQMIEVREYCLNDVEVTEALTNKIRRELEIREVFSREHNINLMSKSDSSIAEKIFDTKYGIAFKEEGYTYEAATIKYDPPEYLEFNSEALIELFANIKADAYTLNAKGKINNIPHEVTIGNTTYAIGIGGIHSQEKSVHFDSDNKILLDIDVVSYYPTIILNNGYIPNNYPRAFIEDYKSFYAQRVAAKAAGDIIKSQTCKIILNGTFGKLGSQHSSLYSPDLLLHVTLTGQLSLLMLIEELEANDIAVVSANTDGILVNTSQDNDIIVDEIVERWEKLCNFSTTFSAYKNVYKTHVNNYLGITTDGNFKTKGEQQEPSLSSNSIETACREAVREYLKNDVPVKDTIYSMKHDIRNFLIFRKSKYGAFYQGEKLGKVVRWYNSSKGDVLLDIHGKKVAGSTGAIPLMEIPANLKFDDIDLDFYVARTETLLRNMGVDYENVAVA